MSSLLLYCGFYRIIDLDARMDFLEMATSLVRRNLRLAAMSSTTAAGLRGVSLIQRREDMIVTVTQSEDSLEMVSTALQPPPALRTQQSVTPMLTVFQPETTSPGHWCIFVKNFQMNFRVISCEILLNFHVFL